MTSPRHDSMTCRTGATALAWEWCAGCLTPPGCRRVPRPWRMVRPCGAARWWYCRPGTSPRRPSSGHHGKSRSTRSTTRCTPWRPASPTSCSATGVARVRASGSPVCRSVPCLPDDRDGGRGEEVRLGLEPLVTEEDVHGFVVERDQAGDGQELACREGHGWLPPT